MQQCIVHNLIALIMFGLTAAEPARAASMLIADTLDLWSRHDGLSLDRIVSRAQDFADAETPHAWLTVTGTFAPEKAFTTADLRPHAPRTAQHKPETTHHQEHGAEATTVTPLQPPVALVDTMPIPPAPPESASSQAEAPPTSPQETVASVQPVTTHQVDRTPTAPTPTVETALTVPAESLVGQIKQGDTVLELFIRAGVDTVQVVTLQQATHALYDIRQLHLGHAYRIERTPDRQLQRFTYDIDAEHRLEVERQGDALVGRVIPMRYEQHQRLVSSRIVGSLYVTLTRQGETPRLVQDVAHIFAGKLNFLSGLQPDDVLCLLLEERSRAGQESRYERILAVELRNSEQRFQAVHYAQAQTEGYYQPDGRPLQGTPLSKQELQTFLAHSEQLLARLGQCQTTPAQRLATLR